MHVLYIYFLLSLRFILFLKFSSGFQKENALFINLNTKSFSKAFFAVDLLFVLKSIYFANQGDSLNSNTL